MVIRKSHPCDTCNLTTVPSQHDRGPLAARQRKYLVLKSPLSAWGDGTYSFSIDHNTNTSAKKSLFKRILVIFIRKKVAHACFKNQMAFWKLAIS